MNATGLDFVRGRSLIVGSVLMICAVAAALFNTAQFFRSYLLAWLCWLGMALGCFGLLMLHHLVGGRWGFPMRRIYEAGLGTLPGLAVSAVPLFFGLHHLYAWDNAAAVAADEILQRKHAYLNEPFFIIRIAVCLGVWLWMMWRLRDWSLRQDDEKDAAFTRKLRAFSGPGLVLFFFTATVADVDLVLSLEPDWYSTVFAAIMIIGNVVGVLAFSIVLLAIWAKEEPFVRLLSPEVWHHLGNLLLAFVMLWAYLAFSQLLVIYSGNLPQEIVWYLHRSRGGWKIIALALGLLHFALPFALLLSRDAKRKPETLARIAAIVLVAHLIDMYWLVAPTFAPEGVHFHWQDPVLFLALGGLWCAVFLDKLRRAPLVPLNDPRLPFDPAL